MHPRYDATPSPQAGCSPSRESLSGRPSLKLELAWMALQSYRTTEFAFPPPGTEAPTCRSCFAYLEVFGVRTRAPMRLIGFRIQWHQLPRRRRPHLDRPPAILPPTPAQRLNLITRRH